MNDLKTGYLMNADTPGIEKTEPSEMIQHMSANQSSMKLAMPEIISEKIILEVITAHRQGKRCFVDVEFEEIKDGSKPVVDGFPYIVRQSEVKYEAEVESHAKLVKSTKLVMYVKNYKLENQLSVVVWSRVPYTCYTVLILQPWAGM
tara:strand:+ start:67863 stop:68303 length:441 start_codon:yes stop_codon:yes gene_type:complete